MAPVPSSGRTRRRARVERWAPVFVLAAGVRAFYWSMLTPGWRPDADADQYVQLSRSLADGHGFSLVFPQLERHATAFRPPLYPLALTPGALLFGDALWPARLLNLVIGCVVVVLAGVLTARIAGRTAGLVAALLVAVYPPLVANDTISLTEPLALALLLGVVLLLDDERWVWAGVGTGLILLTRPNGYLVLAILAVWAWRTLDLRRAAAFAGIAVLVFAPWLVRNQVQVGTWRPTTSDGFTMAAIYAQPAQDAGTFIDPAFSPAYDDDVHNFARFDEAEWNQLLTDEATRGVKDHPGYVWRTVRRNFRGYFELSPHLNRYPERNDGRNWHVRQASLPLFYVVAVVGLVGLFRVRRDPRTIVLVAITAQFVVLSLLLVAPPRLRAPFDLATCIGAGVVVAELLALRVRRRAGAEGFDDDPIHTASVVLSPPPSAGPGDAGPSAEPSA
jgi:4-amino-4-deoxy-L-arabinose transferase-like glycosyltransferase